MRKVVCALVVSMMVMVACAPGAGEVSGAASLELDKACRALQGVNYDYWKLDPLHVGGRTLEVAADIHTAHPGPAKTGDYCRNR